MAATCAEMVYGLNSRMVGARRTSWAEGLMSAGEDSATAGSLAWGKTWAVAQEMLYGLHSRMVGARRTSWAEGLMSAGEDSATAGSLAWEKTWAVAKKCCMGSTAGWWGRGGLAGLKA
ncbi:hypothetical protein DUNSADRAFT_7172 [Dunaliella salina]|uniref:Uncharacterized protein n=1 Tax=Dunaliella salina TaxID=3046 RepID=A0ABQ7FTH7_DUNSA|nr:hypothetical protein DUNSADRAFT_7172 [Dunaliella salina]|eukprot:KAF5825756.1 hypothetical protein DUNSADRAFT_7172 [Dunaliella salina]